MNQEAFSVTEYSRSKIWIVITCLFVRHSLRPGVHIITSNGRRKRQIDTKICVREKDGRSPLR